MEKYSTGRRGTKFSFKFYEDKRKDHEPQRKITDSSMALIVLVNEFVLKLIHLRFVKMFVNVHII